MTVAVTGAVVLGLAVPGTASAGTGTAAGTTAGTIEVLYTGLNNVRKVTWDPRIDAALVAEAGQSSAPCTGDPAVSCFSKSGAIFGYSPRYGGHRIVTGLPAIQSPRGIAGISEVNPYGASEALASFGLGGTSAIRDVHGPEAAALGQVARISLTGRVTPVADLVRFEELNNPDGSLVDSNPYALVTTSSGSVAVDAAANDVLQVGTDGRIRVLFVPPPVPFGGGTIEPVPSSVVRGADGAFYVGELGGAPFPMGMARVWRVVPGQPATLFSTGFTNIIDLAVDRGGRLLVLELAERGLASGDPTGRLVRIERDGRHTVLAREGLANPGGVAVAPNGDVYITNRIIGPDGVGQLLRIRGIG